MILFGILVLSSFSSLSLLYATFTVFGQIHIEDITVAFKVDHNVRGEYFFAVDGLAFLFLTFIVGSTAEE